MKQKSLEILYSYWNEVRAGRIAPRRLEIEPQRMSAALPESFMLERRDPGKWLYRLAGTRLCEVFGVELRDANFLDGWSEKDRAILQKRLALICEQGVVAVLTVEGVTTASAQRVELEAVLLPLVHGENIINRVLGAMSPTTSPHWLGSERLVAKRLLRHELIWPDDRPRPAADSADPREALLPEISEIHVRTDERRTFRVLDGGRVPPKHETH